MRSFTFIFIALLGLALTIGAPAPAEAQTCFSFSPPYPNGCSVPIPVEFVQNGLNYLFLGACNRHDLCYATRNPSSGPCLGFGTKAFCDLEFLGRLEAACGFWAGLLIYPTSGWDDAEDFFGDCSVVAGTFYGAVAAFGSGAFVTRQCCEGCNRDLCTGGFLPIGCPLPGCNAPIPPPPPNPGPIPPCGYYPETATWLLGPEGEPILSTEQFKTGLSRTEERHENSIYLEEWALIPVGTGESGARSHSIESYGQRAASYVESVVPTHVRETQVLVVETAIHARNGREIPIPRFVPFEAELGLNRAISKRSFWFRAELGHGGEVDRVELLEPMAERWARLVKESLRENLDMEYQDERIHRVVVFGRASVDDQGRLEVNNGLVTIPQCCCNGELCI